MRSPRRLLAELRLERLDAEVARWYVPDGQLSTEPLNGKLSGVGLDLRARRLLAVAKLEKRGGRDPHPSFLRPPTAAQRKAYRG